MSQQYYKDLQDAFYYSKERLTILEEQLSDIQNSIENTNEPYCIVYKKFAETKLKFEKESENLLRLREEEKTLLNDSEYQNYIKQYEHITKHQQ